MSDFIIEPQRSIEVTHACDVLVAGGGIAGIAAAMAAARAGKKVILLEREFALGGMATLGLVTIYLPLDDGEGRQVIFGISEELLKLSIEHVCEANYPKAWLEDGSLEDRIRERYITQFNPHLFALRIEKLLLELGVTILYGTLACQVTKYGDAIDTVVVESKSGRAAINVGSVVDATGDADIAHLAGAKTALHAGGNGLASWYYYFTGGKVSLKMFGLADIAPGAVPSKGANPSAGDVYEAVKVESLGSMRFTGVDGPELSRAVISAHREMYNDILKLREKDEAFVPVTISTIPLVRMSRRIVGKYELDESENRKPFTDSIGMTGDWRRRGPAFEIPFRTLYGDQVSNLLTAGRNISVTDSMWDITRVIPPCAVTGQAAGIAAAMGGDVRRLDVAALQVRLRDGGVKLHLDEL
ncbi:MAG: FAD-dependent oxidoreductase [Oscillospiraceae bacterium]|jgi:hypothetical protein|nr:FAD-dependent oxidoreductase [Oscillospiraceae bacterium]